MPFGRNGGGAGGLTAPSAPVRAELVVRVIDSVHGRPAEGITGRLRAQRYGTLDDAVPFVSDSDGYLDLGLGRLRPTQRYLLELEIGTYFAEFGLTPLISRTAITFVTPCEGTKLEIMVVLTRAALIFSANLGEGIGPENRGESA